MTNRTRWWIAMPIVSGVAVGLGCQNESRSTSEPGSAPAANTANPNTANPQQPAARSDDGNKLNMVFSALHAANQEEISESKIAVDRAQSAEIKKFANDMVSDHTSADQKITDLAKRMDIDANWSPRDNPLHAAKEEAKDAREKMLKGLSGATFDIAYIAPEADEHEKVLQIIAQGQKLASGDAKRLLDELKPTVEAHRDHAKNLLTGFRFEASAVGGGPAGGAHPSMEGAEPHGRSHPEMTGGAKHDAGGGWKGTPRSGKGAGASTDTSGNMGSGTSGTRGGGVSGGSTTPPTNP